MDCEDDSSAAAAATEVVIDVVDLNKPKVVDWEELQQELARLCSLSSELATATDRKQQLSSRLNSIIQVRTESLHQTNELEEMREKLEAKKVAMEERSMRTKRILENLKKQRDEVSFAIKLLLVSGKTLSAAHEHLQEANRLLAGKKGYGCLNNMQKMLRTRQQYMVSQVATLYPVKALNEHQSAVISDSHSPGDSAASSPQKSSLTILGLQLTVLPMQKLSFFIDKKEVQKSATVLGYVAHAVLLIASYLGVPLRYPLRLGGSHSYVLDYAPSTESISFDLTNSVNVNGKPTEFPLFLEGQDATRAAYAIFLLNKDLEQLLNYIGAESLGPKHVLANLKEVIRIVQSSKYTEQ